MGRYFTAQASCNLQIKLGEQHHPRQLQKMCACLQRFRGGTRGDQQSANSVSGYWQVPDHQR
jgi:hypothetical protein